MTTPVPQLEDLNDISTISAGAGGFEMAQELDLLNSNTKPVEQIPQPTQLILFPFPAEPEECRDKSDRAVTATKSGLLEAETYCNSKGTFMAELDRFMREISLESKEYNIYDPDISSQSRIQQESIVGTYEEKPIAITPLHILLNKKVTSYVLDFQIKKLKRVQSSNRLEKSPRSEKMIQEKILKRIKSQTKICQPTQSTLKHQKRTTSKVCLATVKSPKHKSTKPSYESATTISHKTIKSPDKFQKLKFAIGKHSTRLSTAPTWRKGSRLREVFPAK